MARRSQDGNPGNSSSRAGAAAAEGELVSSKASGPIKTASSAFTVAVIKLGWHLPAGAQTPIWEGCLKKKNLFVLVALLWHSEEKLERKWGARHCFGIWNGQLIRKKNRVCPTVMPFTVVWFTLHKLNK